MKPHASFLVTVITAVAVVTLAALLTLPATARADELFVYPAKPDQNSRWGNWGTAKLGGYLLYGKETHFTFHIPDTYDAAAPQPTPRLVILLIPPETGNLDYTVKRNVAKDGEPHFNKVGSDSDIIGVTKGRLTEIDISALLDGVDLAVSDYVTVNFELNGYFEKTQVVGLRFAYAGTGGGGPDPEPDPETDCPCAGVTLSLPEPYEAQQATWDSSYNTQECLSSGPPLSVRIDSDSSLANRSLQANPSPYFQCRMTIFKPGDDTVPFQEFVIDGLTPVQAQNCAEQLVAFAVQDGVVCEEP